MSNYAESIEKIITNKEYNRIPAIWPNYQDLPGNYSNWCPAIQTELLPEINEKYSIKIKNKNKHDKLNWATGNDTNENGQTNNHPIN